MKAPPASSPNLAVGRSMGSTLPKLPPRIAATGIDTASGADNGVEFVSTAAAGSDTLSPAVGGFGSTDTDPDCPRIAGGSSISMLEPAVGGWKHSLLRSTKACHQMG